jgi:hypothetical protein
MTDRRRVRSVADGPLRSFGPRETGADRHFQPRPFADPNASAPADRDSNAPCGVSTSASSQGATQCDVVRLLARWTPKPRSRPGSRRPRPFSIPSHWVRRSATPCEPVREVEVADGEGFEPPETCASPVFKTGQRRCKRLFVHSLRRRACKR